MSLVSMTGFADVQETALGFHWRWEVKSVNGRSLDIRLRMPAGFDRLEGRIRVLAGQRTKRGNLQISLTLDKDSKAENLQIDQDVLNRYAMIAKRIAAETGLQPARADGLLALKGVIVQAEDTPPEELKALDEPLLDSLDKALAALAQARAGEGGKLAQLLSAQMDEIARLIAEAEKLAAVQPSVLKERLTAQLNDLVGEGGVQPDRLAQEVALLAVRADVREELDRLTAHVGEARRLMADGAAVGRKLDFLAQEFNREANTLCSKSSDVALTRIGLDLKAMIDQFREQSANVE